MHIKITVQDILRLSGCVPRPSTLSGFLYGTSGCVVHIDDGPDGLDGPILLNAITRKV